MTRSSVCGLFFSVVAACLFLLFPGSTVAETNLRFHLNWVPMGYHAGFFTAMDKGFYKKEGISVDAISGKGSGVAVKSIVTGGSEVAIADAGTAVLGRARGAYVKLVGMFYDRNPMVIYFLASSKIRNPKDLVGKTLAAPVASALRVIFPAFARINNIAPETVNWLTVTPAAQPATLATKKADGVPTYIINLPAYEKAAAQIGEKVEYLWYSDYGLDIFGLSLLSSDAWIKDHPDLLRKFLKGSYEGIRWAIENPEESVRLFLKRRPALEYPSTLRTWQLAQGLIITPTAKKHGLGYIDPDKMKLTRDTITEYQGAQKKIPLDEVYTNAFLPGLFLRN